MSRAQTSNYVGQKENLLGPLIQSAQDVLIAGHVDFKAAGRVEVARYEGQQVALERVLVQELLRLYGARRVDVEFDGLACQTLEHRHHIVVHASSSK